MPSAMQWWMRTMSALPFSPSSPVKSSTRWICHSGRRPSSGCMASSPTRCCSACCMLWPLRRGSGSRTTCAAMSKWASSTQVAPAASCTTRWRKRGYCSRRCCTRSHSACQVTPGESVHTPLIIMRLWSLSMRSQAVSTLLMRSPDKPSMPEAARCTFLPTMRAARAAGAGMARRGAAEAMRVTMGCVSCALGGGRVRGFWGTASRECTLAAGAGP